MERRSNGNFDRKVMIRGENYKLCNLFFLVEIRKFTDRLNIDINVNLNIRKRN